MKLQFSHVIYFFAVFCTLNKYSSGISVEEDLSMTLNEKNILNTFKERVTPLLTKKYMKTDLYLIRWLRAQNFDMNSAESKLRQSLRWRQTNRMDDILKEDWTEVMSYYPGIVDTYDKEGRPVGTMDFNKWDIRLAMIQGMGPRLMRFMFAILENQTVQVYEQQEKGLNVTQWVGLCSAEGFNLVQHACPNCIPFWIQYVQSAENNYYGWMNEFIIIDAPRSANVVWSAVRPFVSLETRESFKLFGRNRAEWMAYLDERISRDQRRSTYGGTKPLLDI